jgi:ABC-type maltose transport system permease subunit
VVFDRDFLYLPGTHPVFVMIHLRKMANRFARSRLPFPGGDQSGRLILMLEHLVVLVVLVVFYMRSRKIEKVSVEHHIVYSKTYHVPQLLIRAWDERELFGTIPNSTCTR